MDGVRLVDVEDRWAESTGDPFPLYDSSDPAGQAGLYVIEPGERVPADGWTAHDGTEVSLVLSGEIRLVTRDRDVTVREGTATVIPAGVEHYSENETGRPVRLVYAVFGDL